MAGVFTNPAGYLLNSTTASGGGTPIDARGTMNFAYLEYVSYSPSARVKLQVSHDNTGWMDALIVTATTTTGTAQISAYYPYVRGVLDSAYSTSASANMYYQPGISV